MGSRIVMGYWDCSFCGTTGIEGTTRTCPHCNHTRENEEVYLVKDKSKLNTGKKIEGLKYVDDHKFEGVDWLCEFCNSSNSASLTHCATCGAPRTKETKTYFDEHKDEVKTNLEDNSLDKWQCSACNSLNDYSLSNCAKCGAPREDERIKEEVDTNDSSFDEYENESTAFPIEKEEKPIENFSDNFIHNEGNKSFKDKLSDFAAKYSSIFIPALAVFGVVLVITALIALLSPHPKQLDVTDVGWKYTVDVESYETVKESGWSLPQSAELLYTKQEISHYKQVLDHYETKTRSYTETVPDGGHTEYSYSSNGDGTYTETSHWVQDYKTETKYETYQDPVYRDEPVYETKYYYNIDKWVYKDTLETKAKDRSPYFGKTKLADNQRYNNETETYFIFAIDKKDKKQEVKTYTCSKEMWNQIETGTTIKVMVTASNHIESFAEDE